MEINPDFVVNDSGQKISAIIPIEKYNELIKKLAREEERIAELEEELDVKYAKETIKNDEERIDFDMKNYV